MTVHHIVKTFVLALICTMAGASTAAAAVTITGSAGTITITGDDGANNVEVQSSGDSNQVRFTSPTDALTAGGDCAVEGLPYTGTVNCGTPSPGWVMKVTLGGGNDRWMFSNSRTDFPSQVVDGGPGDDTIRSGEVNDQLSGGDGDDNILGEGGNDTIDGGAGRDTLNGESGNDTVTGGPGVDSLFGDSTGPLAAFGNDTLVARDGEADSLSCGFGADSVQADAIDVFDSVGDCESRDISAAAPAGGGGAPGGGGSTLTVGLGAPKPLRLGAFLSGRPLAFRITLSAACTATAGLVVPKAEARRLKLGRKDTAIARDVDQVPQGGTFSATLKIKSAFRAKLRKAKSVKATLVLVCTDESGAQPAAQRKLVLKR